MNARPPAGLVAGAYEDRHLNHGLHYLAKLAHTRAGLPGVVILPDWGLEEDLPGDGADQDLDNQWCLADTTTQRVRTFTSFTQATAWGTANVQAVNAWGQVIGTDLAWYPAQVVAWANDTILESIAERTQWSSGATMKGLHHQLAALGVNVPARAVRGGWRLEVDDENTDSLLRVFIPYGRYGQPGLAHITRHAYPSQEVTGKWELEDPYAAAHLIHRATQGPYTADELAELAARAATELDATFETYSGVTDPAPTLPVHGVAAPGGATPNHGSEGVLL